jgi:parallel beta-helix repeat protein
MRHSFLKILSVIGAGLVWIAFPEMAVAVDGVILIDQNRAMAGGVTPGDAPGFPVELNIPGSYRLSGNLTVGTGASAGIKINSGNVTIDLNGFSIIGAGTINAPDIGIDAKGIAGVTVINGNIFNASVEGIVLGDFAKVENLRVTSTVQHEGIVVGDNSIVHGNIAYGNKEQGIFAGNNSLITGNTANHNGNDGITTFSGSTVSGNTANDNGNNGIIVGSDCTVSGNTTSSNENAGIQTGPRCAVTGNMATSKFFPQALLVNCPSIIVGNFGGIGLSLSGCVLANNAP